MKVAPDVEADRAARRAVEDDLDSTLFLEAGAGSGKTSCLVNRFVQLVDSGVPADSIAAITFTEKAASELVERIRSELHSRGQHDRTRQNALHVLDNAAIGTLHAFAQRILNTYPIEAEIPPRFSVNDEIASQVAFDTRWEMFADAMLEDPALDLPLRLLFASGGRPRHLRDIAIQFNANWDMVAERANLAVPPIPALNADAIMSEITDLMALAADCSDSSDLLCAHLTGPVADFVSRFQEAADDVARLQVLRSAKLKSGNKGRAANWPNADVTAIRSRLAAVTQDCEQACVTVLNAALQTVASSIARFTADSAAQRRREGELEFHDLLVLARDVMRRPGTGWVVRQRLSQRYRRLLLDEFQDTDPIQIEIAVLIASDDADAGRQEWHAARVEPGRLFFVGDPKQSIYRFRRADVGMFMTARDELVGSSKQLTMNFRTGRPIVKWVNTVFGQLIQHEPNSQPKYQPLIAVRGRPTAGPPVSFFGREHDGSDIRAEHLRRAETDDVAAVVRHIIAERWTVADRRRGEEDEWRPARWSDIAVLLPARTSLPLLERALDGACVPYRAETSSLVYGTPEIRDLMLVARAVDDPTDSLAVTSALRTPAFGCGDDDLFLWRRRYGGGWDHQRSAPEGAPPADPVASGLSWMGELHRERLWLSASEMLERILRERRFFELGAVERRPRDLWRRLRFVLDQCRAWEEAGGRTFREYLRWVEGQASEGTRVIETVLPETDDDAVRILTVHGAKGLEFPIVIMSGLTTAITTPPRGVTVRFPPGGLAISLSKSLSTSDFDEFRATDEQMDYHERIRLLYVAATRARDHLIVSAHRKPSGNRQPTAAEVLFEAGAEGVEILKLPDTPAPAETDDENVDFDEVPALEEWRESHDQGLRAATRPVATSATQLAREEAALRESDDPGLAKGAKDVDMPPWQKGRYGSAIGRAVHGVLQTVDLATGSGLEAACAAQAAAEGVLGRESVIEALATSALSADTMRQAGQSRHWKEVYVGIPYADGVLEGYIDLLYEDPDGLVIVDYKTDAWRSDAELDEKVARYAVQLRAYAEAVGTAVGREVIRAELLFLRASGATMREVRVIV